MEGGGALASKIVSPSYPWTRSPPWSPSTSAISGNHGCGAAEVSLATPVGTSFFRPVAMSHSETAPSSTTMATGSDTAPRTRLTLCSRSMATP